MCVTSMVGDHYREWIPHTYPQIQPIMPVPGKEPKIIIGGEITREEFDALKKDVEQMKELLERAKKYDEDNGEPDCEVDDKVAFLKAVAELVGVDLEEVFGSDG